MSDVAIADDLVAEPKASDAGADAQVEIQPPAPAPAQAETEGLAPPQKRGGRGAARCHSKQKFDSTSWCPNCKTLSAMTIKPRGIAKSLPCSGLQLATTTPLPPMAALARKPVARAFLSPAGPIQGHATGTRYEAARSSGDSAEEPLVGLDAAFAKAASSKVLHELSSRSPDDAFLSQHVRPVIERLVSEAASAKRSARDANSKAHAASKAESDAKRMLAKVLNKDKHLAHHRPLISRLIGTGFDSERTLRGHASSWIQQIEAAYPGDTWKQMQLSGAIAERLALKKNSFSKAHDQRAVSAVIASLRAYYSTLKQRHRGRYPNDVRAAKMGVDQSVSIATEGHSVSLSAIADLLGADRHCLSSARERWLSWCKGDEDLLVSFRGRVRSDRTPEEWCQFVREAWLCEDVTRASESSHDSVRNPHDKKDQASYRIHWLERRKRDAVKLIQELGRARFEADATYTDGTKRPDGFELSRKIIMFLMPFQVKEAGRHVCLCRYHLQYQYLVEGYYNFRVHLRRVDADIKRDCKCDLISNPYEFRRTRVCTDDREDEDRRYDNRKCMLRTCSKCAQQPVLCEKEQLAPSDERNKASWNAWRKVEYQLKDKSTKQKWDFERTSDSWQELDKEMRDYEPAFFQHHDLWKWQEEDISHLKSNFPRGTFWSVQDFSENGDLHPRLEHQSRYYSEISYTLYGAICRFWVDDLQDELFGGAEKKEKLKEFLIAKGLRPIVQISHIVVSTDLNHDPAFVMHFNEKVLVNWVQSMAAPGVRFDTHYATSDGAPTQFDNADMYLWISKQSDKHGIRFDWTLTCSCHGKAESDPECGTLKNLIWRLLLDGEEIQTVTQAYQVRFWGGGADDHHFFGVTCDIARHPHHHYHSFPGNG